MTNTVRPAISRSMPFSMSFSVRVVDGTGGLVQNQHRRVGAGGAGDVQKLPLALAEAAALTGEDRLITVRQVADEAVRSRQPGRGLHLLVGGVQTAIADVVCHVPVKRWVSCRTTPSDRRRGVFLNVPNIDAVVGDGAGLDLIEPVDKAGV